MLFRGLSRFERQCLSEMYDIVYLKKKRIYNSLYEGHTLLNHIDKIINVYNIVNDKLKYASPLHSYEKTEIFNLNGYNKPIRLKGMNYEVEVSFDELGFDDIVKMKNHNLKMNIFNVDDYEYFPEDVWNKISNGYTFLSTAEKVENGVYVHDKKIDKVFIKCYAINGDIEPISFFSVFLHEFNHYMEAYNRIKNNTFKKMLDRRVSTDSIIKSESNVLTNEELYNLKEVIYRLWSDGEQESLIGDLFGELLGRNVRKMTEVGDLYSNYRLFYKYEQLKDIINEFKALDANILYDFFFVKNAYEFILGGKSIKNMTPNRFKNYFIKHSEDRLNKLYKKGTKFIGDYLRVIKDFEDEHIEKIVAIKNK